MSVKCSWIINFNISCNKTLSKDSLDIYCPGHLRLYEEAKVRFANVKNAYKAANKEPPKKTWNEDFKFPSVDYRIPNEDLPHSD